MATRLRIQCVNKPVRNDPNRHITHVGGINADRKTWKLKEEEAIQGIKDGKYEFYVSENGRTVDVIIAVSAQGHEYLKTKADGVRPDNLLSLPECP
jgi:Protein of unknown function (DUF3892)